MSPDGPDTHQAQAGAAGMRLIHALMEFSQCVADIGKAVVLTPQRKLQILLGQRLELLQNAIETSLVNGIEAIGRRCNWGETHFMEARDYPSGDDKFQARPWLATSW